MKSHPRSHGNSDQPRAARHDVTPRRPAGVHADASRTPGRHGRSGAPIALAASRPCRMSRRTLALADLKLAQIEDAFLDLLLDAHPRRATALDRLLDDVAAAGPERAAAVAEAAAPGPDAAVAAASARRIESALLGAVIQRHPRRDRALDRLLSDLEAAPSAPAAAHGAWVDEEECRRAEFDITCDNDFDGLG